MLKLSGISKCSLDSVQSVYECNLQRQSRRFFEGVVFKILYMRGYFSKPANSVWFLKQLKKHISLRYLTLTNTPLLGAFFPSSVSFKV